MTNVEFPQLGRSRCEWVARFLAALVVLTDTRIVPGLARSIGVHLYVEFQLLAAMAVLASLLLSNGNSPAHGLVLRPHQGWKRWVRFALIAAGVIFILGSAGGLVYWIMGWAFPIPRLDPARWPEHLYWMCISVPIHEELVYRVLLTVALLPLLGFYGTVIAGGVIFAAIHVLGGNAGPDNQIAGFFLQWAYMRSGTVLVPLAMHASGNAIALSAQLLAGALSPTAT
jgi:uncharacterized protein